MLIGFLSAKSQDHKDSSVKQLIDNKNFIFKAQSVSPLSGGFRQLTSEYDLRVFGDTVISYLPYFGRAYAPPVNANEGGIRFTSTNFGYNVKTRKKGGWSITITPKDATDVRQMTLNISDNGYGFLQVISNNRQAISYNGYVTARK
jgi:hypothetical protein